MSYAMDRLEELDEENRKLREERNNLMDGVAFMQQLLDERDAEIKRLTHGEDQVCESTYDGDIPDGNIPCGVRGC